MRSINDADMSASFINSKAWRRSADIFLAAFRLLARCAGIGCLTTPRFVESGTFFRLVLVLRRHRLSMNKTGLNDKANAKLGTSSSATTRPRKPRVF